MGMESLKEYSISETEKLYLGRRIVALRGRIDLVEAFSHGQLVKRLIDNKGSGKLDALYLFKDDRLIREEKDTDGDGYFDLRIFYENERVVRNEADTNRDRRVDVWVFYRDGKLVRQDEDPNFNGRISARYYFKDGQVIREEKVADEEPWTPSESFSSVQEELNRMMSEVPGSKLAKGIAINKEP
jgi:antitoxin component YwqK of YwqJK toxin-antitoxin module